MHDFLMNVWTVSFLTATIVTHYVTKTHASITKSRLIKTYHCQRQCIEACTGHPTMQSTEKNSPLFFSCLDSLCTALLTGRLSLSDVLEMATVWALLTVTVTLWVLIRLPGLTDRQYIKYTSGVAKSCLWTPSYFSTYSN